MMVIYFLNGLSFGGIGLAAYLQLRRGGDFPLKKQLPWLAAFGFMCGTTSWVDMFLAIGGSEDLITGLTLIRMVLQPLTGLLLLIFGWGILKHLTPLPAWTSFIPGILIVPIAYVITYASTTFITPSPIEIPIDIWSRYLLYLPGSIIAGIGFLRQWNTQRKLGFHEVSNLMLGAAFAFLFEAIVVGLIVPAAPYGPASYYNYDRVVHNAFIGEQANLVKSTGLSPWLNYERVLETTGLPIQFWRMLSSFAVTFFVVRGLDVFDAIRKIQLKRLQEERDHAQKAIFDAQIVARQTAERWTDAIVRINRQIIELEDVDSIFLYIIKTARQLLRADFIGLAILSEDQSQLLLKCYSKRDTTEMVDHPVLIENPLILENLQTNRSYHSQEDVPAEILNKLCPYLHKQVRAVGIVTIELDNRPIGALWIARCEDQFEVFSRTDLIWLECMADQVVIAIQQGLMTSQLQSLSITEERARIAREMHDGLAQVLGYLNLQVQTLETLHKQGKREGLNTELRHMRQAIQVAHADVRENILSLRTTLANEKGLITAIDEYLEEFGIQTGIETHFENKVSDDLNLASVAEVQLVCIFQETLANVRKHASASQVRVSIEREGRNEVEYIYLEVIDDGVGFEVHDSKRSFGLQTMRERASSVEGILDLQSFPGKGTTIQCWLPCLQQSELIKSSVVLSS